MKIYKIYYCEKCDDVVDSEFASFCPTCGGDAEIREFKLLKKKKGGKGK